MTWRTSTTRRRGRLERTLRSDAGHVVWLGAVTLAEARAAVAALEQLAQAGALDTWARWHARASAQARDALWSDAPAAAVELWARDWPRMPLRDYWRDVYAPHREATTVGWPSERRHWARILEELGELQLRSIDAWRVADYLDGLVVHRPGSARHGQPAAGNTKRIHRSCLLALLKLAYRRRHLAEVPDLAAFPIQGSTKPVRRRVQPLTSAELRRLLAASSPMHAAMFALGGGNGLRPSEIVRVRWEDLAWDVPALAVRGTKTEEAEATIPLTGLSEGPMQRWWREAGEPASGPAFVTEAGEAYKTSTGWKKALSTAARRAGIGRSVTPYLLRASFATICWSSGIDRDVVRRILRHTDARMLDEVYARPSAAALRGHVAGLGR